ncbi:extracellular solute-binding protein [Kistimonas asteriae]|uniref:extracellular solute-binding protein n=1 Tax=Kistimonas asteriae TaxID=517724 RepID=UPI001BA76F76
MHAFFIALTAFLLADIGVAQADTARPQGDIIHSHGFSLHEPLKYPANFTHLATVNPDAPKGGTLRLMAYGTFDSLNPYLLKGNAPSALPGFSLLGVSEFNETLMTGSHAFQLSSDEMQVAYGLLAESVTYPENCAWMTFHLRPEAKFHDGSPVTPEDVLFSFQALRQWGHPRYQLAYQIVERAEVTGKHAIRFDLTSENHCAQLYTLAELPVLSKSSFTNKNIPNPLQTTDPLIPPLNSGPYRITRVIPGKQLVFERVANYWGRDLPINRGKYNFDRIIIDFYRDLNVAFEHFKTGAFDAYIETVAKNWHSAYDYPAIKTGAIKKLEIPLSSPGGIRAFFFNTRRPPFNNESTRAAVSLMFDFNLINRLLFYQSYQRNQSIFPFLQNQLWDSPDPKTLNLLTPFRKQLPARLFSDPLPTHRETSHPAAAKRQAIQLLEQAGWLYRDHRMVNAQGMPLHFEIIHPSKGLERIVQHFIKNLADIGVHVTLRALDASQYRQRLKQFDFDLIHYPIPQRMLPGPEVIDFFHSSSARQPGSMNFSGIEDPVIDQLISGLLTARGIHALHSHAQAIDRVLLWRHYIIPGWHSPVLRIAYKARLQHPDPLPQYGFSFAHWWEQTARAHNPTHKPD